MDNSNPSIWAIKPWWCQPWSIVLTGLAVPIVSWLLLHHWWITLPIAAVMVVWWVLFLGIVPAQYASAVAHQNEPYQGELHSGELHSGELYSGELHSGEQTNGE